MTEAVLFKLGWVVAAVVAYGLLRWRLMAATHNFRVRAGREADRWAGDNRVPENMQRAMQGIADRMYRPYVPWFVVLGLSVAVLTPTRRFERLFDRMERSMDPAVREEVFRLNARLAFAAVTTSPFAFFVAVVVLLIGLLVKNSVAAVEKRIASVSGAFPLRARSTA